MTDCDFIFFPINFSETKSILGFYDRLFAFCPDECNQSLFFLENINIELLSRDPDSDNFICLLTLNTKDDVKWYIFTDGSLNNFGDLCNFDLPAALKDFGDSVDLDLSKTYYIFIYQVN